MSIQGLKSVNEPENGIISTNDVCIFCDANIDRCTFCDAIDFKEVDCLNCDGYVRDRQHH